MIYAELAGGLGNQMFIYACWTGRTGATVPRRTQSARWTR